MIVKDNRDVTRLQDIKDGEVIRYKGSIYIKISDTLLFNPYTSTRRERYVEM